MTSPPYCHNDPLVRVAPDPPLHPHLHLDRFHCVIDVENLDRQMILNYFAPPCHAHPLHALHPPIPPSSYFPLDLALAQHTARHGDPPLGLAQGPVRAGCGGGHSPSLPALAQALCGDRTQVLAPPGLGYLLGHRTLVRALALALAPGVTQKNPRPPPDDIPC